ncbi:MAG: hypothetical protein ABIK89_07795 [Planctomycetota bacterium]
MRSSRDSHDPRRSESPNDPAEPGSPESRVFERLLRLLAAWISAATFCSLAVAAEPIDVGSRLELFVDDYLIDEMTGARLVLNHPAAREVAVDHNEPWEGNICCGHTVFRDGDLYRMYYRGRHYDEKSNRETHWFGCYAESTDGVHWTKPELELIEFQGSKKNNIILEGPDKFNLAPFKDLNPACKPEERYKAMTNGHGGMDAYRSPDGIHWSPMAEGHVITKGAFDSLNLAFWDPTRGSYVEYHRGFREGIRDIMTGTSDDFLHWTDPVWIEYPGSPPEHLYTNAIKPYYRAPHILMGFPKRFVPGRQGVPHRHSGVSDAVFMTSRDGLNFHRWNEAFVRPGPQKERWVNRNNYPAWGIVVTKSDVPGAPDELSLYTTEGYYTGDSCQLRRHTIRIDGFVSVRAPMAGGELLTKPIVFDGKELVMNFSTSAAGGVQVELQDAGGNPVPGFALADCPEIFGDEIERVVTWKAGADLASLKGVPVRLRFVLKDADLYSIRFR